MIWMMHVTFFTFGGHITYSVSKKKKETLFILSNSVYILRHILIEFPFVLYKRKYRWVMID